MQTAVLGDEIGMEISFPLHVCSMHYNNYFVKCMYVTIVIGMKGKTKEVIGTTDLLLNEEQLADGCADGIRPAAGSRWPDPCVAKPIPALRTAHITVYGYGIVLRCRKVRKRVVTRPGLEPGTRSEEHTSELQSPLNLVC